MDLAEDNIRRYYNSQLKTIERELAITDKRNPKRNRLYADKAMVLKKLKEFDTQHADYLPKRYGLW